MQQLTTTETGLLEAESRTNLGHHSVYLELEPQSDGSTLTFAEVRDRFADNVHLVPALRRRVRAVPLGLDRPWWVEDPHFDLDYHLRHLAVPGATDPEALDQLLARLHERPLDHNRPLWETYLIDHPDGTSGVFVKAHHVMLDRRIDLLAPLTGGGHAGARLPRTRWQPDRLPSDSDLLLKAWWATLREPWRVAERTLAASERLPLVGGTASFLSGLSRSRRHHPVEQAVIDQPMARTSFNRPVGPHRRVARLSVPTDRLRQIRRARDVRFHDVVLAAVSGALRDWMIVHDEMRYEPLVAMTPFMVDDEQFRAGLIPLATHLHEPAHRLDEIAQAMSLVSAELDPRPVAEIVTDGPDWSSLVAQAARMIVTTGAFNRLLPSFNLCVISAPCGPSTEIEGHRVAHQHAIGPVVDGVGLSVTALSHGDIVDITLNADRDLVPDLAELAAQIGREIDLLSAAVGAADRELQLTD